MKKFSLDYVKKEIESIEFQLLSKEYVNAHGKIYLKCNKNHKYKTTWMEFNRRRKCPICTKNKQINKVSDLKKICNPNLKILSKNFKNEKDKVRVRCIKGHITNPSVASVKLGSGCSKCTINKQKERKKLTLSTVDELLYKLKLKRISNNYKRADSKITVSCNFGHTYVSSLNAIKRIGKCSLCNKKQKKEEKALKYFEKMKNLLEKEGYSFISGTYVSAHSKLKIKCPQNHVYTVNSNNFKSGKRCPECKIYKNEEECRQIIEKITNNKFPKVKPDFLKNPQTGFNLELDGYCEELKMAFEYDGEHHYQETHYNNNLQKVKEIDSLKDKLCLKSGILLLRIPYWEKNKEKLIKDLIQKRR